MLWVSKKFAQATWEQIEPFFRALYLLIKIEIVKMPRGGGNKVSLGGGVPPTPSNPDPVYDKINHIESQWQL